MEDSSQTEESFSEKVKEYINLRLEIFKLKLIEKGAIITSSFVAYALIFVLVIFLLLFAFITIGLFFGELVGSYAGGFGILTLLILLVIVLVYMFKDKAIIKPIENKFINGLFKK